MRIDNLRDSQAVRTRKQVKALGTRAPIGDSSITTPGKRLRVGSVGAGGYLEAGGRLYWQGPVEFVGEVLLDGSVTITLTLDVTGDARFGANTEIEGNLDVSAETILRGLTTLQNDLQVDAGGSIKVGTGLTITPGGSYGGEIVAGGVGVLHLVAANVLASEYISADGLSIGALGATILGDFTVFGAKSFGIEHPAKPGVLLRHSATESPVSGTEYVGSDLFGEDGRCLIALPDYFESLNKPDNRFVFITPIGQPFATGAEPVQNGSFVAYGEPGRSFSWLVKAERVGGDFDVESPMPERPVQESNSGQ